MAPDARNADAAEIAATILAGFDKHYRLFRAVSAAAGDDFARGDWPALAAANAARIELYDRRVGEAVATLTACFPAAAGRADEALWRQIKLCYVGLLHGHLQPELAETFFNSVACRVLHRDYFNNAFIFFRPAISTEHIDGERPTYRCYYPERSGLGNALADALGDIEPGAPFADLDRDIGYLLKALQPLYPSPARWQPNCQLQWLAAPFYRNKAAYLIGRLINGAQERPLVIPVLRDGDGRLYLDTLLHDADDLAMLFSFARAYFLVAMDVPSAYVAFLHALLPAKPRAELYAMLGLQKHGKTLFYRDLQHHLRHSGDAFVRAPGVKGMVMLVFTLPSYPYVFKIIKDRFNAPKDGNRRTVMEKYRLVKRHDRVGRLADTLEYSNVAFPLDRIAPELLDELRADAASGVEIDGDRLIVRHVYIERRMIPLNLYLKTAGEGQRRAAIRDYGNAITELAAANIFPGDMLIKNFGVTRTGRVVFYDYDEICYLSDCRFRRLPPEPDGLVDDAWFSAGPDDVFPEQFARLAFPDERDRRLFALYHSQLSTPAFWREQQRLIAERDACGDQADVFPYDEALRFHSRFGASDVPN